MKISMILNGKKTEAEIDADMLLIDFVSRDAAGSGQLDVELVAVTVFLGGKTGAV